MHSSFTIGVVIPAAGTGSRFGGGVPKQFLKLGGTSCLGWCVRTALSVQGVVSVVIGVGADGIDTTSKMLLHDGCMRDNVFVVEGSITRQQTVHECLRHPSLRDVDVVLVHDAARPLASAALFIHVAHAAFADGAAVPVVPVTDTIKRVVDGVVESTPPRNELYRAQTPQGARRSLFVDAYAKLTEADWRVITDDSSVLERAGFPVRIVEGEEQNMKITLYDDLQIAEHWVKKLLSR